MPPELSLLPRPSLGRLLSARSGHGDFAAYHRRFKHNNADIYCTCGQEKSPDDMPGHLRLRRHAKCPLGGLRPGLARVPTWR